MRNIYTGAAVLLLSGCSLFEPVTKPSEVTLEQAMTSVGSGLRLMHEAEKGTKTGLIASEVTVNFALAASKDVTGKLTVDLSRTTTGDSVSGSEKQGGSLEAKSSQSRTNSVTVKFINVMMIPKDTLAYSKTPDDLQKILQAPKVAGWTTFATTPKPLDIPPKKLAE